MKTTTITIITLLLSLTTLVGKTIKIACPEWDEAVALSYLAANLLEDELGYTVEINTMGAAESYRSIATGDQDLFLNAWLPFTHADY